MCARRGKIPLLEVRSKSEENFADITCENEIEREKKLKKTFSALATN
jgi:hypothetical protein